MANRPSKPVLEKNPTVMPRKRPVPPPREPLPEGGPVIPKGAPAQPGDPAKGVANGSSSAPRSVVDANSLHTTTSYDNPQTKGYESAIGQGPTADLRPPVEDSP
jgi:hypothetical protein